MFLKEFKKETRHTRMSKLGKTHNYNRFQTFVVLRCDSCDKEFTRPRATMDPKRLNNNYFCILYTSDADEDSLRVDLCGRRIIKKK